MQSRKDTAWKKSRKFGDIKGGRQRPRMTDNIFARAHSLRKPSSDEDLPIYVTDNPSRDFYFPIGESEVRKELVKLSDYEWEGVTHIWFRRFKKTEYEANELPLAEFCCGSGVRLITIYPWPIDLKLDHGSKKPSSRWLNVIERYDAKLSFQNDSWVSLWDETRLKDYYVEQLLYHEIGHHLDWYQRHWSKANKKILEEVADQYAYTKTTLRTTTYST